VVGEAIPNLSGADLRDTYLSDVLLSGANLSNVDLSGVDLSSTQLGGANLSGADLSGALLSVATLICADLSGADLKGANLIGADLSGAVLIYARCWSTIFANVDLSTVRGLESIQHEGPSEISVSTLIRSRGQIPESFLRGCGLTPWEVLAARFYDPALTPPQFSDLQYQVFDAWTKGRSMISGCFISYSHADANFVNKLRDRLIAEGVNVWLDRHDMIAGPIQDQVWRAIQVHHVVILVLSETSVRSDWVENELDIARDKERDENRAVLCPVSLDDTWKAKVEAKGKPGDPSRKLWRTLEQKFVVDFSGWKTKSFDESFQKLVRGLKVNYGP
jgi:hypothetical protein